MREKERQIEFSRKLIESQEAERQRIATELHDSLGQNLLVVKNRAVLGLQSSTGNSATEEHFNNISSIASETLKEVRFIAHNLRPYQLDSLGLTEAIRSVTKKITESTNLKINIAVDEIDGLLPKDSEINIFRIVQECFNNILRHSGASEAELKVQRREKSMTVTIRDNGKGMDEKTLREKGFGLMGIEGRVKILNGELSIISEPDKGTIITTELPL
jgi:signal transduction histidine kinase